MGVSYSAKFTYVQLKIGQYLFRLYILYWNRDPQTVRDQNEILIRVIMKDLRRNVGRKKYEEPGQLLNSDFYDTIRT